MITLTTLVVTRERTKTMIHSAVLQECDFGLSCGVSSVYESSSEESSLAVDDSSFRSEYSDDLVIIPFLSLRQVFIRINDNKFGEDRRGNCTLDDGLRNTPPHSVIISWLKIVIVYLPNCKHDRLSQ